MNNEIRCPKCGTAIQLDDATRESILEQVKKDAVEEAVSLRAKEIETRYMAAIETAKEATRAEMMEKVNTVNEEYKQLQTKHQNLITKSARMYQDEEQKIFELKNELSIAASRQEAAIEAAVTAERSNSHNKDLCIAQLQEMLKAKDIELQTTSQNITLAAQNKINALNSELERMKAANIIEMNAQKEAHKAAIKAKDDEIAHYKDFRARQSVKLLGESLEEHCRIEYENIRAFLPNASFEKDNKVSETGSKGDFIFREKTSSGAELLSVMFEMKTEEEDSRNKHKNSVFFKELDKDRREKDCEYAVLVTTLEPENDYFNRGIVDVSHKYPKMFVIRPQFFIPLLMLLRSVAEDKTDLCKRISELENEQLSALSLEQDLCDFKDAILKGQSQASSNKEKAIKRIDGAIKLLEETKEDLIKMDKHMNSIKKKAEKVTIQKLKKENPSFFNETGNTSVDSAKESADVSEMKSAAIIPSTKPELKQTA